MFRRFRFMGRSLFIALSLLLILSVAATAAPLLQSTSKRLSTNFTVVNLGPNEANVTARYIRPDGSAWVAAPGNTNFTVAGNFGQKVIAQYFDKTLSEGMGSVVLESNEPLGAVVQIQARDQVPTSGAYSGVVNPANSFLIPQVLRQLNTRNGLANTQIAIQSAEASGAINVNVQLIPYPGTGLPAHTERITNIQPGASFLYDLATEDQMPAGWYGSAVVTAESGNISVVVNIFNGDNSLQVFNAFPSTSVASDWFVPLFTSRLQNGLSTPVVIQNLSGGTLNPGQIVLSCNSTMFEPATFTATNSVAVQNQASFAFNPVEDTSLPGNWSGACRVSLSGKNGVVFVQMRKPGVNEEFAAYEAFPSTATDTRVVVPLVSKRQANGFATAVTIQNMDTNNSAAVTLRYVPSADYIAGGGSSTVLTRNVTIPPGGNQVENHRLPDGVPGMPDGWYGTLVVEPQSASTARPLVAFVQLTNYLGAPGDTLLAHNAFTLP
ncbi:MAG: hypothetical protein GX491_14225 [Chloroflexi bacterium]|nr:hypothetical protein [Chloroflexota bacterium]